MLRPPRIMLAARGWLQTRGRSRRFLILLLCSPVLIPFLFFTFPILCAAELCLRLCGGGRWKRIEEEYQQEEAARLRACEEGRCPDGGDERDGEVGLLQRYLEDQLRLVGSVYECGDDFDCEVEDENDGDVGFLDTNRSPLLG
ncbi:uncharacterized protein LOC116204932 [Punica granatum]|uniref:Uncharacterized protein n=2 Tax=Punica granatum TaxID=22663 RepID=A0A218XJK8_PUNGR|nr:uncharacterized protein LOC116204932 [Punica granatum]OWM85094.1 hypothetical protein CDL15_Pgr027881 [Punica granatum]PKI57510.1 hypothetical protein CRG98_022161 [Punica granatum]